MLAYIFVLFTVIILTGLLCLNQKYGYWKKNKIPYLRPKLLFGNYKDYILLKSSIGETVQEICEKLPDEPLIGAYFATDPALIVQDPELIKLVMTKDFYYFSGREISEYTHNEVMTKSPFFTYGDQWKVLRQNFTPVFSSAKIKGMFHKITYCCKDLEKMMKDETYISNELNVRNLMSRYTMDCICNCAFGVASNTMGDNSHSNPFVQVGNFMFERSKVKGLLNVLRIIWPSIFYGLGLKIFPKSIDTFFEGMLNKVKQSHQGKEATKDFIGQVFSFNEGKIIFGDSIKNLKDEDKVKVNLVFDSDLMISMCQAFFGAGFETSASTTTFTLYELAKSFEDQELVHREVDEYLSARGGALEYDCVSELPHLSNCVDEALRLYPVLGVITREVYEDYQMPNGLKLAKGLRIHIPVHYLHKNKKYFQDPDKFLPKRFSAEERKNIVPYTYLPFGEGPRVCLGIRFAKMQVMAGLVTILKDYNLELADGMPETVRLQSWAMVNSPQIEIKLKFLPRNK